MSLNVTSYASDIVSRNATSSASPCIKSINIVLVSYFLTAEALRVFCGAFVSGSHLQRPHLLPS